MEISFILHREKDKRYIERFGKSREQNGKMVEGLIEKEINDLPLHERKKYFEWRNKQ